MKYIATYEQGKMAWLNAGSFKEAVSEALELESPEIPIPPAPTRFTELEIPYFGSRKIETEEYRNWRREKERIENWNQNRRVELSCVKKFAFQ